MDDIGKSKAECAAKRLSSLNPEIFIEPIVEKVSEDNFEEILKGFDLVYEGGNSSLERKKFNSQAIVRKITYIHASAQYNYCYVLTVVPFISACFECIYPDSDSFRTGPVPVIGCAAGIAGSIAAAEGINILLGRAPTLTDRIWFHQGWTNETIVIPIKRIGFIQGIINTKN